MPNLYGIHPVVVELFLLLVLRSSSIRVGTRIVIFRWCMSWEIAKTKFEKGVFLWNTLYFFYQFGKWMGWVKILKHINSRNRLPKHFLIFIKQVTNFLVLELWMQTENICCSNSFDLQIALIMKIKMMNLIIIYIDYSNFLID